MLTKSIETFKKPHYPLNRGHPNQLLTKQVSQDEQLNSFSCPKCGSTSLYKNAHKVFV